jgi:hypothetical protein
VKGENTNLKMQNRDKYEKDLIELGIESQEDRNEMIQSLWNLVLIVVNSLNDEKE